MYWSTGVRVRVVNFRALVTTIRSYHNAVPENGKGQSPLYELRTYKILPQHFSSFSKLTEQEFHLRTQHSKLVGYWVSELGAIGEVVHLWEYDSLEHRASVRKALANDPVWIERYFSKILPMMSHQENQVLTLLPSSKVSVPSQSDKSCYELVFMDLSRSSTSTSSLALKSQETSFSSHLVGAFQTVIGPLRQVVLLLQHPTLSAAVYQRGYGVPEEKILFMRNKILVPHIVSPLK